MLAFAGRMATIPLAVATPPRTSTGETIRFLVLDPTGVTYAASGPILTAGCGTDTRVRVQYSERGAAASKNWFCDTPREVRGLTLATYRRTGSLVLEVKPSRRGQSTTHSERNHRDDRDQGLSVDPSADAHDVSPREAQARRWSSTARSHVSFKFRGKASAAATHAGSPRAQRVCSALAEPFVLRCRFRRHMFIHLFEGVLHQQDCPCLLWGDNHPCPPSAGFPLLNEEGMSVGQGWF